MDQDVVEDAIHDAEYLLDNVDDLEGEDIRTTEDIPDMDVDELDSDDDMSRERFSRLAADRKIESQPVLETANRLKSDFQQ